MRSTNIRCTAGNRVASAPGRPVLRAASLAALLVVGTAAADNSLAAQPTEWVKGRVLVQARAGLSDTELDKIVKVHGGKARRIGQSDLHIVDLPGNASETAVQARLARNPHLKFAELDGLVRPAATTNDPYLGSEWHLTKIGAQKAWDTTQGAGVTIAIIDTGVDAAHPDLSGRLVPGWNFYNNTADTSDPYNHGTGVAGTAAAMSNNMIGVAGVAGQASILPIRVSDSNGTGSWSAMAQGLTYAADRGVRVANISYMVGGISSVQSAAQYMKSKGGLVFVSAGNTGAEYTTAPSTSLVAVAATDANDARASWSTYGAFVSLAAPGVGIYTTTVGGGYRSESGTSFSSPAAAGVAALVMAANPTLTSSQVESILFNTAVDLGTAGRDASFGYGRVNAAAAIAAAGTAPPADTTAPSVSITSPTANGSVSGLVAVNVNATDNVSVTRVDLRVNGTLLATDTNAPYGFSWDSSKLANGMATLTAVAFDAAGNAGTATSVAVNVANTVVADTEPPQVAFLSPMSGSKASSVTAVSTSASDNAGAAGLSQSLYLNGKLVATASGSSLAYNWNTRKSSAGTHTLTVVARDAAGNSRTTSVSVVK